MKKKRSKEGTGIFLTKLRHYHLSEEIRIFCIHYQQRRSRAAATSKMECFVIIVNGFQSLTIITKHSILDVGLTMFQLNIADENYN